MKNIIIDIKNNKIEIITDNIFNAKLSLILDLCNDLTSNEKEILLFMVCNSSFGGLYIGTYESMLESLSLSRVPLSQAIVSLQEKGYLEKVKNSGWKFSQNLENLKYMENTLDIKFSEQQNMPKQQSTNLTSWLKVKSEKELYIDNKNEAFSLLFGCKEHFSNIYNSKTNRFNQFDLDKLLHSEDYSLIFCFDNFDNYERDYKTLKEGNFIKGVSLLNAMGFSVEYIENEEDFKNLHIDKLEDKKIIIVKKTIKNFTIDVIGNTYIFK